MITCKPFHVHQFFFRSHLQLNTFPHDLHYLCGTLIYLKDHLFVVAHCFSGVECYRYLHDPTRGQHTRHETHFQKRGVGE